MKETHKFEFTEFRRPSKLATSLNLEDFWGMFRLSFKSNSGSETVRIRFAIVIKRHKPSSQLTLFKTKHNHMLVAFSRVSSSFLVFLCVLEWLSWVRLILFCENSEQSKSMFSLCFSDTLMLESMLLPDCGRTFCKTCISRVQQNPTTSHCPVCKKPMWSSAQVKTNFTLKKLVEKNEGEHRSGSTAHLPRCPHILFE